jgi:branched-chain amino acid transport system substrate-binding protein
MKRLRGVWVAGAAMLVLALAAFLWLGEGGARGEPIRIAFAGPTSGPSAEDGLSAVRAIRIVFDRVNAAGGLDGRPLVLEVHDDANQVERAAAVASEIAADPGILAVIGHNFSTCSIAAGEVYAAGGIPAITSAATHVAVTRDNPWYFRTVYNDLVQGRFLVTYVREALEADRFAIVHETEAYGAYLASVMEEWAPEAGLLLSGRWDFDPGDARLEERLETIAREVTGQGAPPVLVLAMQPEAGVALVKRLRQRRFPGVLVVTDALASQAFAGGFRLLPEERGQPAGRRAGALFQA